ncbi:MAG TPA: transcription antitermination factor NusB [Rhabdochlamydiaceae bacterium]|jgi:N utilization substance protein B|nr:transcription antitermination factor NusB [Rhabdochlamydiaceae bacterium]
MREIVFHLLYSVDFSAAEQEESFPLLMKHHLVTKKSLYAAKAQAEEVQVKLKKLDQMISSTATEYEFDRIPRVERNLLRLGAYEIYFSTTPPKVAIDEAVRLAKKFSSAESGSFVNAVLDALYKKKSEAVQQASEK